MAGGAITTVDRALAASGNGCATTLRTPVLEQLVKSVAPSRRLVRTVQDRSEVVFVTAGTGLLRLEGAEHPLTPETAAFVPAREDAELEASADEALELLVVRTPGDERADPARPTTVSLAEREAEDAGIGREFRLLVGPEHGLRSATQFVGYVPPGRARMHNHPYDEVAYVLEGEGVVHWRDGESVPVERGSCIHFPRLVFHSLENVGDRPIRIMGVFHPAGSPADRVDVLDY